MVLWSKEDAAMFKKLGKMIPRYFLYGGISREEYNENKEAIIQRNMETLPVTAAVTSLMFTGLFISSFFSDSIGISRSYYATMMIVSLFVLAISLTWVRANQKYVLVLWYILFFAFGMYAIFLNTLVRPELSATTICVFVVAGPLLVIDRPVRVVGFMSVLSGVFIVSAVNHKTAYLAFADSVNLLCCLLMGITIYVCLNHVRLREIVQAQHLRVERDTDRLTGLLNKTAAEESIRRKLRTSAGDEALIIMDVDDFKICNDTYGHAYGDAVLRMAARCINTVFREKSTCSRFGGDEFVIFTEDMTEPEISHKLENLSEVLREKIALPLNDKSVTISAGVAFTTRHGKEYEDLFRSADTALYAAKKAGKNRYMIY